MNEVKIPVLYIKQEEWIRKIPPDS